MGRVLMGKGIPGRPAFLGSWASWCWLLYVSCDQGLEACQWPLLWVTGGGRRLGACQSRGAPMTEGGAKLLLDSSLGRPRRHS
jgi:hypothetical protein